MTADELRAFALSLLRVHEAPHHERTSFRVGTKIFATMEPDGSEAMVKVAPPEKVAALLEESPDVFFSHGYWTEKSGSLGVRLPKADAGQMEQLLAEAWALVAPKKLQR